MVSVHIHSLIPYIPCLSIICPSMYLCIYPFTHPYSQASIHLCIIHASIYPSIQAYIHPPIIPLLSIHPLIPPASIHTPLKRNPDSFASRQFFQVTATCPFLCPSLQGQTYSGWSFWVESAKRCPGTGVGSGALSEPPSGHLPWSSLTDEKVFSGSLGTAQKMAAQSPSPHCLTLVFPHWSPGCHPSHSTVTTPETGLEAPRDGGVGAGWDRDVGCHLEEDF